jgi:CRISPR type III-A-associated protein Csm2
MPDNKSSFGNRGSVTEKKEDGIPSVDLDTFNFYSDKEKKIVFRELFDTTAEKIAEKFKNGAYGVTNNQIRRLYDEVKRLDQNLSVAPEEWQKIVPYIMMVKSKVAYNVAKAIADKEREKDVYENLSKFIKRGIWLVEDKEDFHVFTALFEAVYGFYYQINPERLSKREQQ